MKKEKHGKLPVNARIDIDYRGEKPSIKFGYPRKDALNQNRGIIAFPLMIILFMAGAWFVYIGIPFASKQEVPATRCDFNPAYEGDFIKNITFICDNGINKLIRLEEYKSYDNMYLEGMRELFATDVSLTSRNYNVLEKLLFLAEFVMIILLIIFIPIIIEIPILKYVIKRDWFTKRIPDIQKAVGGRGYRATFNKVPKKLYIEIPLFKNVYLDYQATKEFSKYLERMEIKEHPFSRITKKRGKIIKEKNIHYWYARFYFKQQPKTGKLEVQWN